MIDFPLNLKDEKENYTWVKGSLWLGLDHFELFWDDVGPVVENRKAVKSAVRNALRVQYTINARNRARWDADPNSSDELDEDIPYEELATTCFRTINETAGTNDAERVAVWLTKAVYAAENESGWHYLWNMLLYRLGEVRPSTLASHGIPIDTAQKLVKIAVRHRSEVDAIEDRIEAVQQEPHSEWDIMAYDDHQANALSGIRCLFKYVSFDKKWPEVMRCLPPAYIDALIRWGRANVGPNDPSYDHVTIPDDIRAAWHQAWAN